MPPRLNVTVVGRVDDPEDYRLRDFLTRSAQPYDWLEAGTPDATAFLGSLGARDAGLAVVADDEGVWTGVTVEKLADAWELHEQPAAHYDLAIIGAGPAGLAAAVYAASDGLSTVVFEEFVPGGQASHTSLIENFLGFPDGIKGAELARLAGRQAEKFDARLVLLNGVRGGGARDGQVRFELARGETVTASVAIAAPGMEWRRLEVPGVDELLDRGVYYGAGRSEASRCCGDPVVVIGAGNSAGQAAMNLADNEADVTMVVRGDSLSKSMSGYLVDRIERNPRIEIRLRSRVTAVDAGDCLTGVTITGADGAAEGRPARALFICIGGTPRTGWADREGVRTDRQGFILTGPALLDHGARPAGWALERDPLPLETSVPGLFAAGDVRHGSIKRVGSAVGEGAMAVALAHVRLEELAGNA